MDKFGLKNIYPFRSTLSRAYEAPFPNPSFKMGPRAMPRQVPIFPRPIIGKHKKSLGIFFSPNFKNPFLWFLLVRSYYKWRGKTFFKKSARYKKSTSCFKYWWGAFLSMDTSQGIVRSTH
ncbi:MAG: hypothetical protein Ct9H300mP18_01130 [Candidatus Neomarinimicrobiota bacterium]|nr:MAG: hypothetical protein Ct9H300mP18_01130 [Candidatus Neomarinimicrobiota bacterium]